MASSSSDPDSLVTLHFHDFRVERMRHWWTLLGEDDHADIVGIFGKFPPFMRLQVDRGLLEALASFWDPTHCCFSIGEVDLVPTLEEYAELLQLFYVLEIARPEETWRKANISLDLLTKYFSRSDFPVKLARDFIAGKKGWKKFRINAFKIAFAGDRERGFRCSVLSSSSFGSAVTCGISTASRLLITFERHTVTWGPAVWKPWTHCALFDGVPLPGVWGCTGYYPSLALRQFGGVQYPPRLGDLDAVTFDYIPSEDMWRLLSRVEVIWEGRLSEVVLIEDGSPGDSSVASDFVEWREGWTPFFTLRPTVRPGTSHSLVSRSLRVSASTGQPERVTVLERELEEAQTELLSLRLARAAEREASAARVESLRSTLHHNSVAVANLRRDLEAQRGNVSTLRTMNEFIREQLEISEDAKEQLEETLAETREQLETEQAERTRDIVALRRALDASEEALTSARTSMGAMRVQISVLQGDNGVLQTELDLVHDALESNASWLNQEGFPCGHSSSPDQSGDGFFGCQELEPSWEEHDEGDPALSTALGRFCRETCIRLGH
uniref:DUF7745 domain-containing protein n=1 Tax=Fagus sylvatica TaxID=28930 RepID=A0A2N9H4M1_FAGSY